MKTPEYKCGYIGSRPNVFFETKEEAEEDIRQAGIF